MTSAMSNLRETLRVAVTQAERIEREANDHRATTMLVDVRKALASVEVYMVARGVEP